MSHLMRGFFLYSSATTAELGTREQLVLQSISSYQRASQLDPGNMNSYQGMVESFCCLKQFELAMQTGTYHASHVLTSSLPSEECAQIDEVQPTRARCVWCKHC